MSVNTQKVVNRLEFYAPEHQSKSQSIKEEAVKAAMSQRINASVWANAGALTDGAAYLAAHLLTMRDKSQNTGGSGVGGGGPIEAIREGELEVEWATGQIIASGRSNIPLDLAETEYGIAFQELAQTIPSTPITSG